MTATSQFHSVQPLKPSLSSDWERYEELREQMRLAVAASDTGAFMRIWQAMEDVKGRHAGNVPPKPL
jgi:hypothetical protein